LLFSARALEVVWMGMVSIVSVGYIVVGSNERDGAAGAHRRTQQEQLSRIGRYVGRQ
jgi:hypothetical protein